MIGIIRPKILFSSMLIVFALNCRAQTVSDFVSIPFPDDLEVDRFGNIWVNYRVSMATSEHRLAKISPAGTITDVIIENHTLGQFGINDSIIWIAGEWGENAYVYKYNHTGNRLDSILMPYPTAIILDPDGTWYVTQNALGKLTKVYPNKTTQTVASGYPLNHNLALARDEYGMFYTCNLMNAKVIKIDPNTGSITTLTTLPAVSPYSVGFLCYNQGKLYVPSFKHCIYKVDTSANAYSVFAGSETNPGDVNGAIATALLNTPIATYPSVTGDTLYFTDSGNNKVKMITGLNNTTGISENRADKATFKLYPNPVNETLYIQLKATDATITKIDFITIDGKKMDSVDFLWTANKQLYILSLEDLPKATYMLAITTSKGDVYSKKIIRS